MNSILKPLKSEQGSALFIAMIALIVLTAIGIMAINNTSVELQIAGNDRRHKIAFLAAESARGYVNVNTELYNSSNVDVDNGKSFPLAADDADESGKYELSTDQAFSGTVTYDESYPSSKTVPGIEIGEARAHVYKMCTTGTGPGDTTVSIVHGFYRIGK